MLLALTAVRAAIIFAVALAAMRLLARTSAATRRSVLVGAFAIVLVLPIATALLPALHLRRGVAPAMPTPATTSIPGELVEAGPITNAARPPSLFPATMHAATAPRPTSSTLSPLAILLAVWALGAAMVLARLGLGLVRARRLVRVARFVETLDVDGRPVEVRVSAAIETPAVTGLFVPVVLLPHDAETWTAERRRVVLAHEIAHITNGDCLASAIAQLAVALHWFDPLAWLAARRLRIERELAADDQVLDQVPASSYAEHLLAIATAQTVPTGVLAMAEASQVEVRIRALLAPRPRHSLGRARFVLGAAALALATLVACATPEPETTQPVARAPKHVDETTTIDPAIQAIVDDEIDRMTKDWAPCAAIVLVLDPTTGNVLAAGHRGGTESTAQLAAVRPMVPGSTMKPLVIAAALEEGAIQPTDTFDASPSPLTPLEDAEPHGVLDVREILAVSSNVGLAKIFDRLGGAKLASWGKRFHLSVPVTIPDGPSGAAVAIGAKFSSNPLEIAGAFAALANGGIYHTPTFVPHRDDGERVVRADTATTVLGLLEGVTSEHGTGKAAHIDGVRVAGKTGTSHLGTGSADYYASFVGTAPADHPRYVIFVGAETPRDGGSGGKVAAPVFARVMNRLLTR